MRCVLVTGAHGFVGSHLLDRLLERGCRVRCLCRRPRRPASLEGRAVEVVAGDIRDPAALEAALEGVDDVYHLAALTRSVTRRQVLETNVGGTANLIRAAVRARLPGRFLFCSSLAAAGPSPDGRPLDETDRCRPVTWYGESKLAAERAVARLGAGLATTVIRPPAVYGPYDRDFLAVFRAAARGLLPVLGDRPRRYHFVYAADLAEAMVVAASSPATVGRTYFVVHPEILTAEGFARHVQAAVGRPAHRVRIPDATLALVASLGDLATQISGRPQLINRQRMRELAGRAYLACAGRLARETGFRSAVGAAEGTALTLAWYRQAGWL